MMYNISTKKEEKKLLVKRFTSEDKEMKNDVIKKITDIEASTMNDLVATADWLGITVSELLESIDGRNFVIKKNSFGNTLFRRKYYNDVKKFGEYNSVGFTAGM